MTDKKIFGIDLGTTYSCISHMDEFGQVEVIDIRSEASKLLPSVLYVPEPDDDGKVSYAVGRAAKEMAAMSPERVIAVSKRHMPDALWRTYEIDGEELTPVDVAAAILRHITNEAAARTGNPVEDVVITVPAYFGTIERKRTEDAGKLAGLNVHGILAEPMAAALHYEIHTDEEQDQTLLVYDLGGGTFDVTIMQFSGRSRKALAVKGDHNLGGYLWDEAVALEWAREIAEQADVDEEEVWSDPECRATLLLEAEKAKIRLTMIDAQKANVSFAGRPYQLKISRATFDSLTESLLENTISLVDQAREIATRNHPDNIISKILLVGSSTMMPQVSARLEAHFGPEVTIMSSDPHFAVAKGAAKYAHEMQIKDWIRAYAQMEAEQPDQDAAGARVKSAFDTPSDQDSEEAIRSASTEFGVPTETISSILQAEIEDVSPKSFGVVHLVDGGTEKMVTNLIRAQDKIPARGTQTFGTHAANQESAEIICVENDRELGPDDPQVPYDPDEMIGVAHLKLQPGLPAGSRVTVTIEFDKDGIVHVHARDDVGGNEATGEFVSQVAPLSPEELEARRRKLERRLPTLGEG